MILTVDGDATGLLDRLAAARAAGHVPLVFDERWPQAQLDAVSRAAAACRPPADAGWATLTSGSSGQPRIVVRTAASWEASFADVSRLLGVDSDDALLLPAPPASSLTLFSLAHALADGPRPILRAQAGDRPIALHGTPQALQSVLEAGSSPSLRTALIGGAHLDRSLRERASDAGIRVVSYYGAAELSFVAIDTGDGLRAFPRVDMEVRDGVLWVRSPYIALDYANGDGPLRRDGEWATVGDRAELIDGRLRLLGRTDNAILSAAATIVPEEVEAVLRSVPGIRDAVVFGLPTARVGALVAALVELDGTPPGDIRRTCIEQLAPAHRPRQWFTGSLPRTASGKPARAEVVRRVWAGEVDRLVV